MKKEKKKKKERKQLIANHEMKDLIRCDRSVVLSQFLPNGTSK